MKRPYIIIGVIAALVAIGTAFALSQPKPEVDVATVPTKQAKLSQDNTATNTPIPPPKLIIGNADAKLTVIEYSDPQCPICKRFFENTEPQLLKEYVDTGKVNLELRVETHIGQGSQIAGEAWYCAADQGKFKAFHDETFRQQSGGFTPPKLKQIGSVAGLDSSTFNKCLDDGKYTTTVKTSNTDAKSRISSTPTFFINSQKIVGAQPYTVFKTVIEAELK